MLPPSRATRFRVALLALVGALAACSGGGSPGPPDVAKPVVCEVGTTDGDEAINAVIAACPDGGTVRFPEKATYHQDGSIRIHSRKRLTVEGNGSTFVSSAPNDNGKLVPQWWLSRSQGITLRNMVVIGNFADTGTPHPERGAVTSNAGVSIYGGSDIVVEDLVIRNVFGDGVTFGNAAYHDPGPDQFPANVRLSRLDISTAGRHCVSVSQGTGIWVQDSILDRCFYIGIDAEKDVLTDPLGDLHFLRLTMTNYFGNAIFVPVGGPPENPVRGVEMRGNRFPSPSVGGACNNQIAVGAYGGQFFADIVIEENTMAVWRPAIFVAWAQSGSVRNNVITQTGTAGSCESDAPIAVVDSPQLVVADNG